MFCNECGKNIKLSKYCGYCGVKQQEEPQELPQELPQEEVQEEIVQEEEVVKNIPVKKIKKIPVKKIPEEVEEHVEDSDDSLDETVKKMKKKKVVKELLNGNKKVDLGNYVVKKKSKVQMEHLQKSRNKKAEIKKEREIKAKEPLVVVEEPVKKKLFLKF